MANSWGNLDPTTGQPTVYNQDLVSDVNNKNILKVSNVDDGSGGGDNKIAVEAVNGSTATTARALKISGRAEFLGPNGQGDAFLLIRNAKITNTDNGDGVKIEAAGGNNIVVSTNQNYALQISNGVDVTGRLDVGGLLAVTDIATFEELVQAKLRIAVGNFANGGRIDVDTSGANLGDLKLGTMDIHTNNVIISRTGKEAQIKGNLRIDGDVQNDLKIILDHASIETENGNDLNIGTVSGPMAINLNTSTGVTKIKGIGIVEGQFAVGTQATAGKIDSQGENLSIKIGTGDSGNVEIGRSVKNVIIAGNLIGGKTVLGLPMDGSDTYIGTPELECKCPCSGYVFSRNGRNRRLCRR